MKLRSQNSPHTAFKESQPFSSHSLHIALPQSVLPVAFYSFKRHTQGHKKGIGTTEKVTGHRKKHDIWTLRWSLHSMRDLQQKIKKRVLSMLEALAFFFFFFALPWLTGLRTWRKELGLIICRWLSGRRAVDSRHSHTEEWLWNEVQYQEMLCRGIAVSYP